MKKMIILFIIIILIVLGYPTISRISLDKQIDDYASNHQITIDEPIHYFHDFKWHSDVIIDNVTYTLEAQGLIPDIAVAKLEFQDINFQDKAYAVAYLGYETYNPSILDSLGVKDPPIYVISPGDYYLIIPRYYNSDVTLSSYDIVEDKTTRIASFHGPFIVQCNISDIIPDAIIEIDDISFSPFISLKDGNLDIGKHGLNITKE